MRWKTLSKWTKVRIVVDTLLLIPAIWLMWQQARWAVATVLTMVLIRFGCENIRWILQRDFEKAAR